MAPGWSLGALGAVLQVPGVSLKVTGASLGSLGFLGVLGTSLGRSGAFLGVAVCATDRFVMYTREIICVFVISLTLRQQSPVAGFGSE